MMLHIHIAPSIHLRNSRSVSPQEGVQDLAAPIRRQVDGDKGRKSLGATHRNLDLPNAARHNFLDPPNPVRERNHHSHPALRAAARSNTRHRVRNLGRTEKAAPLSRRSHRPVRLL